MTDTQSTSPDWIDQIDLNLSSYASEAGRSAHDRGLEHRGAVTKIQDGVLVVERRDGSLEIIRKVRPGQSVRIGTMLKRRRRVDPSAA